MLPADVVFPPNDLAGVPPKEVVSSGDQEVARLCTLAEQPLRSKWDLWRY